MTRSSHRDVAPHPSNASQGRSATHWLIDDRNWPAAGLVAAAPGVNLACLLTVLGVHVGIVGWVAIRRAEGS